MSSSQIYIKRQVWVTHLCNYTKRIYIAVKLPTMKFASIFSRTDRDNLNGYYLYTVSVGNILINMHNKKRVLFLYSLARYTGFNRSRLIMLQTRSKWWSTFDARGRNKNVVLVDVHSRKLPATLATLYYRGDIASFTRLYVIVRRTFPFSPSWRIYAVILPENREFIHRQVRCAARDHRRFYVVCAPLCIFILYSLLIEDVFTRLSMQSMWVFIINNFCLGFW